MKFRHVKTGKPWTYSFVRGTSVEKVVELLTKADFEKNHPQFLDETIFHVYAHPDFPKNYDFSEDFHAKKERDNILPAKYFAQQHASQDYLSSMFMGSLYSAENKPVDFEKYNYRTFYSDFSEDLESEGYNIRKVEDEFVRSRRYKGVLIYFNELLLENLLFADKNERQHQRFNSVKIYSENPVHLDCLKAIEPLSTYDNAKLNYLLKKVK